MPGQSFDLIKLLRGGENGSMFSAIDQIDFCMKLGVLIDINDSRKAKSLSKNEKILSKIKDVILSGRIWMMNPTCQIFRDQKTGEYIYDQEKLVEYIFKKGKFTVREIDVDSSYLEAIIPLSLLMENINDISDDVFLECTSINVTTFMGKVKIK